MEPSYLAHSSPPLRRSASSKELPLRRARDGALRHSRLHVPGPKVDSLRVLRRDEHQLLVQHEIFMFSYGICLLSNLPSLLLDLVKQSGEFGSRCFGSDFHCNRLHNSKTYSTAEFFPRPKTLSSRSCFLGEETHSGSVENALLKPRATARKTRVRQPPHINRRTSLTPSHLALRRHRTSSQKNHPPDPPRKSKMLGGAVCPSSWQRHSLRVEQKAQDAEKKKHDTDVAALKKKEEKMKKAENLLKEREKSIKAREKIVKDGEERLKKGEKRVKAGEVKLTEDLRLLVPGDGDASANDMEVD